MLWAVFCLMLCFVGAVHGQSFTPTGSMSVARQRHTATLLDNGLVLVTGGTSGNPNSPSTKTAELYHPDTGQFTPTANTMFEARQGHTATKLPNGLVLITGGTDVAGNPTIGAEIYNPATNTFSQTGFMNTFRTGFQATLLDSGRVLITGGYSSSIGNYTKSAELYNPTTGAFTNTAGTMNVARGSHTSTKLLNGQVLVTGGNSTSGVVSSAELYDPGSATFSNTTGSMSTKRFGHQASLMQNGVVLVTGGFTGTGYTNSAQTYNPSSGLFGSPANMGVARQLHTSTALTNNQVLITGGTNGSNPDNYLNSAEVFDFTTGAFTPTTGVMTARRYNHTATLLPNGKVLIVGGSSGGAAFSSAELYNGPTFDVSGKVTLVGTSTGLSGVTVNDNNPSAPHTGITDVNGNYTLTGLTAGSVSLTATKSGYEFNPNPLAFTLSATKTDANFTATQVASSGALIGEFRAHGSGGTLDEYIELANTTTSALSVGGWQVQYLSGGVLVTATFPNGATIPAMGHYLLTGSGYNATLSGVSGSDQSLSNAMDDATGITLLNAASSVVDAVSFTGSSMAGEGTLLPSAPTDDGEYAFVRRLSSGLPGGVPLDYNTNSGDFVFVSTTGGTFNSVTGDGTVTTLGSVLGAPSPDSTTGYVADGSVVVALLDSSVASTVAPNRIRLNAAVDNGAGAPDRFGTLRLRRTLTNTGSATYTRVRFHIVSITTLNGGGYSDPTQADVRLLTSPDETAIATSSGAKNVFGTTLQVPSTGTAGGGYYSNAVALNQALTPGASANYSFELGVARKGNFSVGFSIELLP